jgi:hypothetical protein
MEPVGGTFVNGLHFFGQSGKIGCKQGRGNEVGHFFVVE